MGSAWSVYMVSASHDLEVVQQAFLEACPSARAGGWLTIGPEQTGWRPLAFETESGGCAWALDDADGVVAEQLATALDADVWMLYGASNTDEMELVRAVPDAAWLEPDAERSAAHAGFDLWELRAWANFGISGADFCGARVRLGGSRGS